MFALTTLYCILFFYIRIQLKNFRKVGSTSELQTTHELQSASWQANLEAGTPEQPAAPKQIITTQTVTVTTEERPVYRRTMNTEADRAHRRMNQVALTLLCYPITYICLTMPLSISRLSQFASHGENLTAIYIGASLFCCSGFVNVLLYTATRKGIISWDWLFKKRRASTSIDNPPPPYNPHYPGSHHVRSKSDSSVHLTPPVVSAKPSVLSVASINRPPLSVSPESRKSPVPRDSDSEYDFQFSEGQNGSSS
jgi:hypothetical protein